MRHWKGYGLCVAFAVALLSTTASAQEPKPDDIRVQLDNLNGAVKRLEQLENRLSEFANTAALSTAGELSRVLNELKQLHAEIALLKNAAPPERLVALRPAAVDETSQSLSDILSDIRAMKRDLDDIRDRSARPESRTSFLGESADPTLDVCREVREELRKMREDIASLKQQSRASSFNDSRAAAPASGEGLVRFLNRYPSDVRVIVNGNEYFVNAFESRRIRVPAGRFTYRVPVADNVSRTRSVVANDTFEVEIFPQRGTSARFDIDPYYPVYPAYRIFP